MSWHSGTGFDPPSTALASPQQTSLASPILADESGARKRKRISLATDTVDSDLPQNPGGGADSGGGTAGSPTSNGKQRHQPGVKRACNDCRQQKVRSTILPPSLEATSWSEIPQILPSVHDSLS